MKVTSSHPFHGLYTPVPTGHFCHAAVETVRAKNIVTMTHSLYGVIVRAPARLTKTIHYTRRLNGSFLPFLFNSSWLCEGRCRVISVLHETGRPVWMNVRNRGPFLRVLTCPSREVGTPIVSRRMHARVHVPRTDTHTDTHREANTLHTYARYICKGRRVRVVGGGTT